MSFLRSPKGQRTIAALVAVIGMSFFFHFGGGEASVVGNLFRELGEALVACLILADDEDDRPTVLLGALAGLACAVATGAGVRDAQSWILNNWQGFAGVLAVAMPYVLLGFAAWHLLPHTLHHHMMPGKSVRRMARSRRTEAAAKIGLFVSSFLVVWREGFEFSLLSLNQGTARVLVGILIGTLAMAFAWWMVGDKVKDYIMQMNVLLIATGFWMILGASEAFVEDAKWSSKLLAYFQFGYAIIGGLVLVVAWSRGSFKAHAQSRSVKV